MIRFLVVVLLASQSMISAFADEAQRANDDALWMQVSGSGEPTVVFISGNGNGSSVWLDIEKQVGGMGVRTVLYDRAGLGQSPLKAGRYSINDEADALKQMFKKKGVSGPLVLVAHSYGGLIAVLVSEGNLQVQGMVFVDALLPSDLSDAMVAGILAEYTPEFEAWEEVAPKLAKAMIPVVKAYPETARRVKEVHIPPELPFIDILAEHTWISNPKQIAHVHRVHAEFVAASPARSSVMASNSGHNVMRDQPRIIVRAISLILGQLSGDSIQ